MALDLQLCIESASVPELVRLTVRTPRISVLRAYCDLLSRFEVYAGNNRRDIPEGKHSMATFITTITFTQQGVQQIGETTKRATAVKAAGKKMGVKVSQVYWTLGGHDGVLLFEAANDETAAAFLIHLGAAGNVRTETVRAFSAGEMDKLLEKAQLN